MGYPNRKGLKLCRVVVKYCVLGILQGTRRNQLEVPNLEIKSNVWRQYSAWLVFQLLYIGKKDWARTPLIRDVTLVQVNPLSAEYIDKIGTQALSEITSIANGFSQCFRGIETKDFFNWLCRNQLLLRSFEHRGVSPLSDGLVAAEIGPGLGPVTSLLAKSPREIFSYDTFEMQEVQKYVESMVIKSSEKIQYHITNLEKDDTVKIPEKTNYFVIAFYSFTEINVLEREKYVELIGNSTYSIIASNQNFEGVNNFDYLENLGKTINKEVSFLELQEVFGSGIPNYVKKHRIYLFQSYELNSKRFGR
jgi:hypothetical protein